ncbi:YfcC family protein [Flagellimonas alvinocaridis]|uniref:YfcC family protein n=1 Tax=Flagellimonas alvinocaridis TaxID=2530200 RepID=A0A4S8RNT9_9FLAO|nr:Na+/H+ antiporter NhaC family protein [Allomuricauda alvinocaridis]THV59341.1 YfcC family protein [Allomuricauda alvinocaridis]
MKKFPNAFVILIAVIIFAWILTYIIPQGSYQRILDEATGTTKVLNDSYQTVTSEHLSLMDLILSIPRGIIGRADAIVLILLIGGCFYVIEKTGALNQGLVKLVKILEGKETLALILVTVLFTAGGVTIGMQEEVIAMIPILLLFGKSLGYNTFTIILMSYGSTVIGSSFSPSNPFAVIIAQKEAGLPLLSGSQFRLVVLAVVLIVWITFIIRYANKNRIDKTKMPSAHESMTTRSKIILSLLALTFCGVIYGLLFLNWDFNEMSASFFALGIVAGLIGQLGVNGTGESYIDGFKEMMFAAILLGLANSISLLLKEGMIMDTIVYGLFGPLKYLSPSVSAVSMMVAHSFLHFPVPSYSGQAVLTMPILIPLSDLIGVSRQTCVLAYQYGAVMADMIVPTNGALMAVLALCNIPYNKWLKFALRPTLLIVLIAAIALVVSVAIGYQ